MILVMLVFTKVVVETEITNEFIKVGQTERKISFVLHEPDNESEGSSNTTLTVHGEENNTPTSGRFEHYSFLKDWLSETKKPTEKTLGIQQRRPVVPVRPFLLRRGTSGAPTGGSFKRRSLKLRRGTKDGKDIEADCKILLQCLQACYLNIILILVRRTDSIQSRRKVSSLSDRSDTSEPGAASGGEESPGILRYYINVVFIFICCLTLKLILTNSDDQPPESPSDSNETDDTGKNLPWMRPVFQLMNSFNYYCSHQNFCHPYCYRRHMRASTRLIKAVRKVSNSNV